MAKQDFLVGVLKGLYEGGVGNPAVAEQRRKNALEETFNQQKQDALMAEKGMMRDPAHPATQSVVQAVLGNPGTPQGYISDPNAMSYAQDQKGKVGLYKGTIPEGVKRINDSDKGATLMSSQLEKPRKTVEWRSLGRVTDKGFPLYMNPYDETAGRFFFDTEGNKVQYNQPDYPPTGNPSSGTESKLAEIYNQQSLYDGAMEYITPDKVGILNQKFKTIGAYLDDYTDPDAVHFQSLIDMADTLRRNQYYGASLTDSEKSAFRDISGNRNLSLPAFLARVDSIRSAFGRMEDGIRRASSESNRPIRGGSTRKSTPIRSVERKADFRWNPLTKKLEPIQ